MPRLKSIHLSRVGHPSARLDGVSIYFTAKGNPDGKPEESTIVGLRNGGGKTSLLQLMFSTFVPDKREFSGRTSEGGERTFDQYFQPNDLGMIVTEWDLGEGMPIRIVGQCVVKTNISDTSPQQCFFSFLVTDQQSDFQVTDLPMRQFESRDNPGNASSFSAFKQLLRSAFVMQPHQQLMITETQKEWLRSLRSWGYEPDLFRLLIALNKSEGGSKEMAKNNFGTTEKMIGLIAMLSISEQDRKKGKDTGNIYDLISKYREDLLHLPEKETEKKMWEQLSEALTSLISPGQELVQAQHKKSEAFSKLNDIGQAVIATPAALENKIAAKIEEMSLLDNLKKEKAQRIRTLEKEQNWIDREILKLKLTSAQNTYENAVGVSNISGQHHTALKAHNIRMDIKSLDSQRKGHLASISEQTEPTRDIEDTLHALGHRLNALLTNELSDAKGRKKLADERYQLADTQLTMLREEENNKNIALGEVKTRLDSLNEWFEKAELERISLDLDERSAEDYFSEVDAQRKKHESRLSLLKTEETQLQDRKLLLHGAQIKAETDLNTANSNLKQHEEKIEHFDEAYKKIATDENLCLLIEDEEIDPYSPGLNGVLNEKESRLENEKFNLTIEQRRSRESLNFLESDYKLMPPPEDIWCVCEALKNEEIQAHPYVKYLSEINLDSVQIRDLLVKDPGRYGGVCIVSSKDLPRAMSIVGKLESLRGPVQIYPLDKHSNETFSSSITESGVALPSSNATFDLAEASSELHKLTDQISNRKGALNKIEERIDSIKSATKQLNMFLDRYPDGTENELSLKKEHLYSLVESQTEKLAEATHKVENHGTLMESNVQEQQTIQDKINTEQRLCQKLETYISSFESLIDIKVKEQLCLKNELKTIKSRLAAIGDENNTQKRQKESAERDGRAIQEIINDFGDRKNTLEHTESNRGKVPSDIDTKSLENLQSRYESFKEIYEERNKSVEVLMVMVQSLKERIEEKRQELRGGQIETIPECIFKKIIYKYGENKIAETVITSASEDFEKKKKGTHFAESALNEAKSNLEKFCHSPSELLDPEDIQCLTTIDACTSRKTENSEKLRILKDETIKQMDEIKSLKTGIDSIGNEIRYLNTLIQTVRGRITVVDEPTPSFSGHGSYQEALDAWIEAERLYNQANDSEQSKLANVNKTKKIVSQILGDERFSKIATIIRQRINSQMETLHLDAAEFTQESQNALSSVEYTLSKTKEQLKEIVDYLLDDVRTVKSNLDALDRMSEIPETDTKWAKWSGRKFFRVKVDGKRLEDGYGWTKIEEYIQKLVNGNEKSFPTCAQDIIEGVAKFSLKDITTITTMKPDHFMSTNPETLEEAARWSGGEGFTYAALSLMVLNQLICHINASVNSSGGILVVDNPIGICNHLEFIKLQQIMAKILDNQLIYPTAVKDFDALSLFPNVVTLSNNRVDARTGFKHVQVEDHTHNFPEITTAHMTFSPEV
nr:hypothetical protein [uncultured Desulfuromonas sp.]